MGSFRLKSQCFTAKKGVHFGLISQCFIAKRGHFELKSQWFCHKKGGNFQTEEPLFPVSEGAGIYSSLNMVETIECHDL